MMSREIRLRNAEVHVQSTMDDHLKVAEAFLGREKKFIVEVAERLAQVFVAKRKLLIAGNGGSAGDAQHFAAELTGRYLLQDRRALPAIALTTDTSALTAIANDYSYAHVFARQVEALGQRGDMFVAISTSGNSENIVKAAEVAKAKEMVVVALTGENRNCKLAEHATYHLCVPTKDTPRIQEMHIWAIHEIVDVCEKFFLE